MTIKDASAIEVAEGRLLWRSPEAWLITLLVMAIYLSRLTTLPVSGEEPRWAGCASLMIETGDWIVPRQQGVIYPDRPPLGSWTIAVMGLLRGKVDAVAIRLPSVLAIWITSLWIYGYARGFLSSIGAIASSLAYATSAQVMQLGRLGENEAVYSMLLAGALLTWHWGYWHKWSMSATWSLGYGLVALAFLVKGPQAPVYFVAATTMFTLIRREWKWLFGPAHAVGIAVAAAIVGVWLVPFYLRTDLPTTLQIVGLSSAARYTWDKLPQHLVTFPLEIFGCLLPWSILAMGIVLRRVRTELGKIPEPVVFMLTAAAVAFPSVWFSSWARGRYFMPLYPCLAIALGWITQQLAFSASGSCLRSSWNLALRCGAAAAVVVGIAVLLIGALPGQFAPRIGQPLPFALVFFAGAIGTGVTLFKSVHRVDGRQTRMALGAVAAFFGLGHTGVMINSQMNVANDPSGAIAVAKQRLEQPEAMVSFGAADHRFCYFYGTTIKELPWPSRIEDVPADVTCFCFTRFPNDTPEKRASGRFWNWTTTSGTLPFEWEEVSVISCDRKRSNTPYYSMVIGRIIRSTSQVATNSQPQDRVHR